MSTQPTDRQPEAVTIDTEQASTNFYWTLGSHEVFNLQTTIRAQLTDAQIAAHLDTVKRTLLAVVSMDGHAKSVGMSGNGKQAPVTTTVTKQKTAPAAAAGKPIQSFVAKLIEVTPKPDGKAELKFYADGHKYPDLYATKTVEQWLVMLGPAWTADDFAAAVMYEEANIKVEWQASDKLNSKGNPYKDLVALHPAG